MLGGSIANEAFFWITAGLYVYLHFRVVRKAGLNPLWALVSLALLGPVFFARSLPPEDLQLGQELHFSARQWLYLFMPLVYVAAVWRFAFVRWPTVDDTPAQRPLEPPQ
ncbi:hypothetical protein AAU61_02660 [Desulfocarbo indianensis]|nr:hypothetical protein AAU61_02660 [Desulfocarbo indianensis]